MTERTQRVGVFPGSFDPVHNGHMDLIERARRMFDVLYIAVLYNEQKQALFSVEERIEFLRDLVGDSGDCRVESLQRPPRRLRPRTERNRRRPRSPLRRRLRLRAADDPG